MEVSELGACAKKSMAVTLDGIEIEVSPGPLLNVLSLIRVTPSGITRVPEQLLSTIWE
jgi:hypothetical protein